ncbi:phosphohistidine phosphatase SixA [Candidatus Erwinia haradaeae]|uniref:Phosphohistidine phosphatase SixA n=1 Tax=Candidatus Erwinia haradaeae TaxID=1922217 RepID=A0A451D1R4_9GAMM|nr:phosphohistidine phosphatase SixA [Candidatus Erwinia haradaeae]VFP79542.1 Phosphohistidine phosphatase SixA [Candidatus Erwinia haradaeae]
MKIFIMRHGESVLEVTYDFFRPLTPRGYYESRQIAKWMHNRSIVIEKVLISPYLRAQQTLNAIKKDLPLPHKVDILLELIPEGIPSKIKNYLHFLETHMVKSVMIISHLPMIKNLLYTLCPQTKKIIFTTSEIICINFNTRQLLNELQWQMSPQTIHKHHLNVNQPNTINKITL